MYSLEQMWKLLDDGTLLSQADQAHERMEWGPKMKWLNHPGPPEIPFDYYNSDGPWAFGPEDEKGRFYIEHTDVENFYLLKIHLNLFEIPNQVLKFENLI